MSSRFTNSAMSRIVITNAIVAVLLAAVFSVLIFENQLDLIAENALMKSLRTGMRLKDSIERLSATGEGWVDDLDALVGEARALEIHRLVVFSGSGAILFAHNRDPEATAEAASLDELRMIHRAITSRDFQSRLFTHTMSVRDREIDLFIPFLYGVSETGVISAQLRITSVDVAMRHLSRQALMMSIIVLVLHTGLVILSHGLLVSPLRRLVQAANVLAEGGHDLDLPVTGTTELATLSDAFREMSHAVWQMQDSARAANPLSGLPGNVEIEKHVRQRMSSGESFAVLYCDLDNFKTYNDKYGFNRGDQVILYVRDCLISTGADLDEDDCFVGHQGGDDFVVVCPYEEWERYASGFVARFDHGVEAFYDAADRTLGYIRGKDRQGRERRFPLMSVSVAAATNKHREFESFGEIVRIVADMKQLVKGKSGSQYAIDRRIE